MNTMRLLVFSDLHGEEHALDSLKKLYLKEKFEHVLVCGDISRSVSFAEDVLSAFPDAFVIPGNWDSKGVNALLKRHPGYAHEKRFVMGDGLNVVGFGYSPITPFHTFGELSEEELAEHMHALPIDRNTILMLHSPPKGYFDYVRGGNVGSQGILDAISEKKPLAAFFGHIHEYSGSEMLGSTTLVKLPAASSMQACIADIERNDTGTGHININFVPL